MPLIVDKDKVRCQILDAFQECIKERPLSSITLREIAKMAGMSHPKLLNYFSNKEDLVIAYCHYARTYMVEHCKGWFACHNRKDYVSNLAYLNAFMQFVADGEAGENRPNATIQTYVLAQYSTEIRQIVVDEFREWRKTMEQCLAEIFGSGVWSKEGEAMMILITGTFVCNYTGALTGEINTSVLSCFKPLISN